MHKYILYAAYGWLTLTGILHFIVDVVSQHLRGKHPPGIETTLYYGLHSAFALGQLALGLVGLLLAWRAPQVFGQAPLLAISFIAGLGWLAITFQFMSYWEPKLNVSIFCALILAAILTR